MELKVPPVPRLLPSSVAKCRDRLLTKIDTVTNDDVLITSIRSVLSVPMTTLAVSRLELVPALRDTDRARRRMVCWRLAGSIPWLRRGTVVGADFWKITPHWAALAILGAVPARRRDKPGTYMQFRVLTGPAAGLICRKFWSSAMSRYAASQIGFSAPWGDRPHRDPRELVGLRLAAFLDPQLSREDSPGFQKLEVSSGMVTRNRRLIERRKRLKAPCPLNFPKEAPCYACPAGKNRCPLAVRALSFIKKRCAKCASDTLHDPNERDACVACREKQLRNRKGLPQCSSPDQGTTSTIRTSSPDGTGKPTS